MLRRWLIKKACQILDKYDAWPPPVILYRESPPVVESLPLIDDKAVVQPQRTVARNFSKM